MAQSAERPTFASSAGIVTCNVGPEWPTAPEDPQTSSSVADGRRYGFFGWLETRTPFRCWQPGGGSDHDVFRERTVAAVIEYIHANPVRRGLVAQPTEWEWSSARFWEGRRDVPLEMDQPNE